MVKQIDVKHDLIGNHVANNSCPFTACKHQCITLSNE